MIIVIGNYKVEPQDREQFLTSKEHRMRKSRAEPGCLEFVFAADPLDSGRIVLLERWESQAALDAHIAAVSAEPVSESEVRPTAHTTAIYHA